VGEGKRKEEEYLDVEVSVTPFLASCPPDVIVHFANVESIICAVDPTKLLKRFFHFFFLSYHSSVYV